jgi:hypothetical protein
MTSVTWIQQHALVCECVKDLLNSLPDIDMLSDQSERELMRLNLLLSVCVPARHTRRVIKQFERYMQSMRGVCASPFSIKKQLMCKSHMLQLIAHIHAQPVTHICESDLTLRWLDYHQSVISYLQYRSNKQFVAECQAHARACVCSDSISHCISNVLIDACVRSLCE